MQQRRVLKFILAVFFFGVAAAAWAQEALSLEQYLSKVEAFNPEVQAIDLATQAMGLKILEMDMVYFPFLNGDYTYLDDLSGPGIGSTFLTKEIKAEAWSVGASEKFPSGTTLSLGYSNLNGVFDLLEATPIWNPRPVTHFDGTELKPFVKLDQSLLRDFLYGVTQAGIDKSKAAVRSGQYFQLFKRQQILLNAQMTYWQLVLAKEVVAFRKLSLERTEKLLHWNENRVGLDLADSADLLQAQAAYKSRQLNLQMAVEDEEKSGAGVLMNCWAIPRPRFSRTWRKFLIRSTTIRMCRS